MEYRRLGHSGLSVSAVSYGNWITHGSQVAEELAVACVRAALEVGITTFDTADMYANTRAEEVLGRALQNERRESLEILTKVYWPTGPGGPNDRGLSRKHVMESANASLRRLRTDYVDVYQAHQFDHTVPLEETMLAFADLVRQGKALYIGVSDWGADQITRGVALARELRIPLISSQTQYSMLYRPIESQVIPTCEREGLGQIVWSPLAQGVLTGKYLPGAEPPPGSRATDESGGAFMAKWMRREVLERVQNLVPVAAGSGLTMAQLALAWVLQNPNVGSAIIGASRPEQIAGNVKAVGVTLDPEVREAVDKALGDLVERDPRLIGQLLT